MKEDIIPDLVNKATSFRTFLINDNMLSSPIQDETWDNPQQKQAFCKEFEQHQSPEKECQCGIYGFHTYSQAKHYTKFSDCLTITEHWGKTEVHSNGLRSEYAAIKAIMPIKYSFFKSFNLFVDFPIFVMLLQYLLEVLE